MFKLRIAIIFLLPLIMGTSCHRRGVNAYTYTLSRCPEVLSLPTYRETETVYISLDPQRPEKNGFASYYSNYKISAKLNAPLRYEFMAKMVFGNSCGVTFLFNAYYPSQNETRDYLQTQGPLAPNPQAQAAIDLWFSKQGITGTLTSAQAFGPDKAEEALNF